MSSTRSMGDFNNSEYINSIDQNEIDFDASENTLVNDETSEETSDEIENYLCIYQLNDKLAACYYNVETQIIYYLQDILESGKHEITGILLNDVRPFKLLVSTKCDESLLNFIKSNFASHETSLITLPNNEFNYELAKRTILEIKIPKMKNLKTPAECFLFFNTLLNFDYQIMIRSMGALLRHLYKSRINVQLERERITTPILDFKSIQLSDILLIDEQSLKALQIFHTINHPSIYKQSNRESTSLFSLFSAKLVTPMGNQKLRSWFVKPCRNVNVLEKRHQVVEFFIKNENQEATNNLSKCLKQCKNLTNVFKRIRTSSPNLSDWTNLLKTSESMLKIYKIIKSIVGDSSTATSSTLFASDAEFNLFEAYIYENIENLKQINKNFILIEKLIDFKKSAEAKRIIICEDVNIELDRQRNILENLPDYLLKVSQQELQRLSIKQCNVLYIQQQGFMVAIRSENFSSLSENQRAAFEFTHKLRFLFNSDNKLFYKDDFTDQLDAKIGDISSTIASIERTIINELQLLLRNDLTAYAHLLEICAEMDVCLAYSKIAKEYNYVKPILVSQSVIEIKKSRHPLMDIMLERFIPNDVDIGCESKAKIKLLTGPNACGKSIYLKQVGICVFLAYIGSYVPAQSSPHIGDIDRIYTRINSNDSISSGLSTFSIDLHQIATALNDYTNKSLILIDEFGKGTLQADGMALFGALIKYFLENESKIPYAIVTTHFHEALNRNLFGFNTNANVQFITFDYLEDKNGHLTHLYTMKRNHITRSSFALNIARNIGINSDILSRSITIYDYLKNNEDLFTYDTHEKVDELNRCKNIVQEFFMLYDRPTQEGQPKMLKFREFLKRIVDENKRRIDNTPSVRQENIETPAETAKTQFEVRNKSSPKNLNDTPSSRKAPETPSTLKNDSQSLDSQTTLTNQSSQNTTFHSFSRTGESDESLPSNKSKNSLF